MPREVNKSNNESSNASNSGERSTQNEEQLRRSLYQPNAGGSSPVSSYMDLLGTHATDNKARMKEFTRRDIRHQIQEDGVEQVNIKVETRLKAFVKEHPEQAGKVNEALNKIGWEHHAKLDTLKQKPDGQAYKAFAQSPYSPDYEKSDAVQRYEEEKFKLDVEYTSLRLDAIDEIDREM